MIAMEALNELFRMVFDDDSLTITRATTANDIEEWDSLTHMNLVMAIEKQFKIRFPLGELRLLQNVGAMLDLINAKIAK